MRVRLVIGIGGAPGVGKSAAVRRVMERLGECPLPAKAGLAVFHLLREVTVLGDYRRERGAFPGPDGLSMACHADCAQIVEARADRAALFEGDRLYGEAFLKRVPRWRLRLFELTASEATLVARRTARGSNQNPSWILGRETKIRRLRELYDVTLVENETEEQLERFVEIVLALVRAEGQTA